VWLAVDGIDEWLDLLVTRPRQDGAAPLNRGQSVVFRETDPDLAGRAWRLEGAREGIARTADTLPGNTIVAGPAVDLFLVMVRREPLATTAARIDGDPRVWEGWRAKTPL
jgi:hypothetical protein